MTVRTEAEIRALAILNDHAHALHPEQGDSDECPHPGCSKAYWFIASIEEAEERRHPTVPSAGLYARGKH